MKKLCKILLPVFLLLAVVMVGYGAENQKETQTEGNQVSENRILTIEGDGVKVAYDQGARAFSVTDQYGYTWNSVVGEELYSSDKLNEAWTRKVRSILNITYADISKKNPAILTGDSYEAEVTAAQSQNELCLNYYFKAADISLTVLLSVDEKEVVLEIPASEISEGEQYKLLSVEVLPYFGACGDNEEGYLVYPDGCGALKYHQSIPPTTMSNTFYSWDIYGDNIQSLDTLSDKESQNLKTAMLPVYGIKKGDHAFIAFSEKGEEEGTIQMYPSGYGVALNRMSFSFRYRTSYYIQLSNISINGNDTAKDATGLMYNQEMIAVDHDVHLSFLGNDEADYSGMAGAYREKLVRDGTLQQSELVQNAGVSVNILMAASEQGFWKDSVATVTTAGQAQKIIDFINQIGFEGKGVYTLKGWGKGGYGVYPQTAVPDGKVARISEFTSLLDSQNLVALQSELLYANKKVGGFSKRDDVIKEGSQNVITDKAEELFLLNPGNVDAKLKKLLKTYESANRINLSLESVGKILYRDENKSQPMNRVQVRQAMESMLEEAGNAGVLMVEGANLYTLKYADLIYELPAMSSQYFISDMDIPFCQMVLHGSVVYSGDYGNLSSDYDRQLLEWLEYGYVPAFELTYGSAEKLKDTNCRDIYTSQYESNAGRIEKAYELYEDVISKIADAHMTEHTVLQDGVVKIDYSNNITLLLNYTKQDITYDNVTVSAGGYRLAGD